MFLPMRSAWYADRFLAAIRDELLAREREPVTGTCDDCAETYDVSDRIDHCGDCGTCWNHCRVPSHRREEEGR